MHMCWRSGAWQDVQLPQTRCMPFLTPCPCGTSTRQQALKAHLGGGRLPRAGAAAREGLSRGSRAQRAQAGPAPDDVRRLPCGFTSVSEWRRQQRQAKADSMSVLPTVMKVPRAMDPVSPSVFNQSTSLGQETGTPYCSRPTANSSSSR